MFSMQNRHAALVLIDFSLKIKMNLAWNESTWESIHFHVFWFCIDFCGGLPHLLMHIHLTYTFDKSIHMPLNFSSQNSIIYPSLIWGYDLMM